MSVPFRDIPGLTKESLSALYLSDKKSPRDIAQMFGVSVRPIIDRLQLWGIPKRTLSEAVKLNYLTGKLTGLTIGKRNLSQQGKNHPSWKGGRSETKQGYILVYAPGHHHANKNNRIFEHILIWEHVHNKPLPEGMVIHHLNGIKNDNRPENLIAMTKGEHVNQTEPYKKRIRILEAKVKLLERTLESNQLVYHLEEN